MGQSVALRGATPCFIGWFHFFLLILALVYPLDSLGHCLRSWPAAVRAPPIPAGCDREGAGTGCGKSHGGIGRTVVVCTAGKCVTVKRGSSKGFPRFRRSSLSYPDCAAGREKTLDTPFGGGHGTPEYQEGPLYLNRDGYRNHLSHGHVPSSHGARRKAEPRVSMGVSGTLLACESAARSFSRVGSTLGACLVERIGARGGLLSLHGVWPPVCSPALTWAGGAVTVPYPDC